MAWQVSAASMIYCWTPGAGAGAGQSVPAEAFAVNSKAARARAGDRLMVVPQTVHAIVVTKGARIQQQVSPR